MSFKHSQLLPKCNAACPAGQNVQKWLFYIKNKEYKKAWLTMLLDNPLPGVTGYICNHLCEYACNRRRFDERIRIRDLECFIANLAITNNWTIEGNDFFSKPSGKQVLIVGSGPAGLACAFHLKRLGHQPVIYEKDDVIGGKMRLNIPEFRLPTQILDQEIKRIRDFGVEIKLNSPIFAIEEFKRKGDFAAAFIATGLPFDRQITIPQCGEGCQILYAGEFLKQVKFQNNYNFQHQDILVYGGGNSAIDVARVAKRLKAKSVKIIYRRNREKMPAHKSELEVALQEGVILEELVTIQKIENRQVFLNKMLLENGKLIPTSETQVESADWVICALGSMMDDKLSQEQNLKFTSQGNLEVNENLATSIPGIFAGGDIASHVKNVTVAIGQGKRAAFAIDAFLKNSLYKKPILNAGRANFENLHLENYEKQPAFSGTLNESNAFLEAKRCFSCGNCLFCDCCLKNCPVGAISKENNQYKIDQGLCIKCGLCFNSCPVGAIIKEDDDHI